MAGIQNLKPWRKGESGNPGGRPRRKMLTEQIERLLEQEAPHAKGRTWAAVIAETLLKQARKGNVRAIAEISDRVEGKARQAMEVSGLDCHCLEIRNMTDEQLEQRHKELLAELERGGK